MKNKMRIAALALSMLLLLSMGLVYAESGQTFENNGLQVLPRVLLGHPQPRKLLVRSCGFTRAGDLTGRATISASSTINAEYIRAEVTVQKLNRTTGVYYDYDYPYVRTERNTNALLDTSTIRVGSSGTYRFKVVFSENDAGEIIVFDPMYSKAEGL